MLVTTLRNVLSTLTLCLLTGCAPAQTPTPATVGDATVVELLEAEVLDTVALDQPTHFPTPQTADIVLPPGTYRVMENDANQMKLISVKNQKTILISALSGYHEVAVSEPIALHIRTDDNVSHILLMLPNGQALEAVGSYDATRSRGVLKLTPIQIQEALRNKLKHKQK